MLPRSEPRTEWLMCSQSPEYFVARYVRIYNATRRAWIPFELWRAQGATLSEMHHRRLLVILKARQLGLSWLSLAYALWLMVFRAPATVLLFSLRETEAIELLARLHGMYNRLPDFMRARTLVRCASKQLELSTGSRALAFSTRGGRSYTGTLAIVDEADFTPDLALFLNAVKPTIDGGGKLFLISTPDKSQPVSTFKNIYRAAEQGIGAPVGHPPLLGDAIGYRAIFLPWHAHPERDEAWYRRTRAEMFAQRGTDDDFFAEYPATPEEALAPEQLDRRIPLHWLQPCIDYTAPLPTAGLSTAHHPPPIPQLAIYVRSIAGHHYVAGADPAEGNPNSDDSALTVLDAETWEEVASLAAKVEPTVFAGYMEQIADYYDGAGVLVERNNHGHTVIAALAANGRCRVLDGYDGRPGWLSNVRGKVLLYDACADAVRDQAVVIRTPETVSQLASIEASTLRAPARLHDDRADSFALAVAALRAPGVRAAASVAVATRDALAGVDEDRW